LKEKNISCITATHDAAEALAFSDTLLILKNGATEVIGSPEEIYNSVASVYQAGFFDEVNLLPSELFTDENSSQELLLFPHQLEVSSEKTRLEGTVTKNYFKGNNYLVEGCWHAKKVFFSNAEKIVPGSKIFLGLNH
jgi:ABC-type Fe3+/spermidine/putrescine transport system ATPase subunit